eukprot:TRINITY_DN18957_c0_g1_i1.p1 TRINITY_DN18957_c0_g1~~TRINITY_DN18957_c0_g1_i1.p1  ORF type:complete len:157 (+),score=42.14 TRINITY_DN18957_c0_g1_i1:109-579(+)
MCIRDRYQRRVHGMAFHLRVRAHPFQVLRINKMLSCAGADRLQTGMRHAFGKPLGVVARVHIGQPLLSVRTKDATMPIVVEALRRAKYKFPGRQRIIYSNKWGFTKLTREEYEKKKTAGEVIPSGAHCQLWNGRGPLAPRLNALREMVEQTPQYIF